jgi:hypothetical protein
MATIRYNDMDFTVEQAGEGWDLTYKLPSGASAVAASGLYKGLAPAEAELKAVALLKTIFPVGIKSVGPDTLHPNTIGDLKIVGPDVLHPNFIYWNKDSVSFPKEI